jgi:ADP-ribose pyrophosphatase YjhB (NUDIX family)
MQVACGRADRRWGGTGAEKACEREMRNEANVRSYSAEHQRVEVPPQEDIGMPE